MRVGVTIDTTKNLWSSGINQNAIYLSKVLSKINGVSVHLISNTKTPENQKKELQKLKVNTINLKRALNVPYDVLINLGFNFSVKTLKKFKNIPKIINYKCGNDFLTDTETILFNHHEKRHNYQDHDYPTPDQVWYIPQMENTNHSYYQFLTGQDKATVVPFIWDPMAIENKSLSVGLDKYSPKKISSLGVMEPNISVFKHLLMPIVISEKFLKENNLDKFMFFSSKKLKENKRLINVLKRTRLLNEKKISVETRFPTPEVLKKHVDIVLSWQWENPLNYLYLDVAWMGYPIVHNAELCKDVGYYYHGFDASHGASMLKFAIDNHNEDKNYLQRNRDIIKRYTPENKELVNTYSILLDDLMSGKFSRRKYNSERNSIS
jgi:hypothetical protein